MCVCDIIYGDMCVGTMLSNDTSYPVKCCRRATAVMLLRAFTALVATSVFGVSFSS